MNINFNVGSGVDVKIFTVNTKHPVVCNNPCVFRKEIALDQKTRTRRRPNNPPQKLDPTKGGHDDPFAIQIFGTLIFWLLIAGGTFLYCYAAEQSTTHVFKINSLKQSYIMAYDLRYIAGHFAILI